MIPSFSGITNPFPWAKKPRQPDGSLPAPARCTVPSAAPTFTGTAISPPFTRGGIRKSEGGWARRRRSGDFSIRAVWLHDAQGAVLPLPLDYQVVKEEDKEKGHPLILTQEKEKGHWASDGTQWRLYASEDRKSASAADAYLGESEWREKAAFHRNISSIARAERWLQKEPKIGIARDAQTMRAKEGMLYQLPMHRFREEQGKSDTGLLVLCDRSPSFDDIRYVLLGGEGRPWHLTPLQRERLLYSEEEEEQLIQQIREREMARIILLTPAIWKRGTRPACYDETTQELHLPGDLRVKLLTAAVGRPLVIGGWDMKKNRPKPRKLAVPAGSVLVVKVKRAAGRPAGADDPLHETDRRIGS